MATAHDQPVRRLVVPGLLALGRLAPRRDRMAAARGAALAAAMRVVDRVHRHAAHRGPAAEPAVSPGLADHDVLLVGVRHRADRRPAFGAHHAQLAGGQPQQRIALVAADQLGIGSGRAGDLAALAGLHLDIVDDRADRHAAHRHRVAGLDVDPLARDDDVAGLQPLRRQDIGEFAVLVADQRDKGGAVRIVFETLDRRRHVDLGAFEIDDPIAPLVAAAAPAHRVRPVLLRPPLPRSPSVKALTGLPFHSSLRSTMTSCRRDGVVGLKVFNAIVDQIPVVTSIR